MTKIKSQMPPKRLYDFDPGSAKVFENIENQRIAGEQVERLKALAEERGVDFKKITKLSELAKLVPELQTRQKPGLKTTVDVLSEVARKANEDDISPTKAAMILYGNHQRWLHAKAKEPQRWAKLVLSTN